MRIRSTETAMRPFEKLARTRLALQLSHAGATQLLTNFLILGLWLYLYRAVFDYFAIIFTREDFRTNQLVLVGVLALIAFQIREGQWHLSCDTAPHFYLPALSLALGGSVLYLLVERYLDINTVSASLFGLASYGLLGLWMEPRRWREGLPAALLLIGALPFGDHMQTFIGYPMRILTAGIVRDGLAGAGIASTGIDTILMLENSVSQVDLPCSGVKSLWTGGLFLLAATWIERRPLNLRWLLVAIAFGGLLFITNLARVTVLVVVGQVLGWQLAAQMLHVPLGVLGFAGACAAAAVMLRTVRTVATRAPSVPAQARSRPAPSAWLTPFLAVSILAMGLAYTPRPHTGLAQPPPGWKFSPELVTTPLPLNPDEVEGFTRDGAESADRRRFEWRGITGSMILIPSTTWRAHHRPERCFEVYGLSLDDSSTHLVTANFPVRYVALSDRKGSLTFSATYWFQSATRTTDDYGTRVWADLSPVRQRWVLVSILFDGTRNPDDANVRDFYLALHETIARTLTSTDRE